MNEDKKYQHGFKVPDGYFDALEASLQYRIMEDKLPSNHGFRVPKNYFDGLEESLFKTITKTEYTENSKAIPLWRNKWGYVAGFAASLLLAWVFLSPPSTPSLEEVPVALVEEYIQNGTMDLEWYDLAQLLSESDMEDFSSGLHFEEEQLESYLLDHLDESTLLQE